MLIRRLAPHLLASLIIGPAVGAALSLAAWKGFGERMCFENLDLATPGVICNAGIHTLVSWSILVGITAFVIIPIYLWRARSWNIDQTSLRAEATRIVIITIVLALLLESRSLDVLTFRALLGEATGQIAAPLAASALITFVLVRSAPSRRRSNER